MFQNVLSWMRLRRNRRWRRIEDVTGCHERPYAEKISMRVEPKPLSAYPRYLRPFFWNQKRKYGRVLDAALLWARSPKLFLGVAVLYGMIDRKRFAGRSGLTFAHHRQGFADQPLRVLCGPELCDADEARRQHGQGRSPRPLAR